MRSQRFWFGTALAGGIGLTGLAAALVTQPALAGHLGRRGPLAQGPGHGFCPRAGADARELEGAELEHRLAWMLRPALPSEEQIQRIAGIAEDAMADLCRVQERAERQREALAELLAGARIDRAALEAARAAALAGVDAGSERALRALADAAEVLTPEQRAKLVAAHAAAQERGRGRHRWF